MAAKPEGLDLLRQPFPPEQIGKLPKGGMQLDYVGHADVTDRLLDADPAWTWEPLALDEQGLPRYDKAGGLWIRLTVCGVTRLGYGDGPDPKQRISDALRNASMRYGVALALWAKGDRTFGDAHDAPVPTHKDFAGPKKAERGKPPREEAAAFELPVVTDHVWYEEWKARVLLAATAEQVREEWPPLKAKWEARELIDSHYEEARALLKERMDDLAPPVTDVPLPVEVAS